MIRYSLLLLNFLTISFQLSFIESFVDPTVPSRQRPSGKRAQRRQELIAAKGANTSENKDLKANQGSKLAMKITDFLDL